MIDQSILLSEAKRLGIPKDPHAIETKIDEVIAQAAEIQGVTREDLLQYLAEQGVTEQELRDSYYKQLTISELLEQEVTSKIEISDQEIQEFYNENIEFLVVPANATARHILIMTNENRTDEKALGLINTIANNVIPDPDKFCDFVTAYSEDPGSVANCGEYKLTEQDSFVQEFKDKVFGQNAGEMGIAKTTYGYHLIWTVEKNERRQLELSEVWEMLENALKNDKLEDIYTHYILSLIHI